MGRRASGPRYRQRDKQGPWLVRFTAYGVRVELTTGETDRSAAEREGARLYAEALRNRPAGKQRRGVVAAPLADLVAEWLEATRSTHAAGTVALYELHWGAHLLPWFGSLDDITTATIGQYTRARLAHVTRTTVVKERGTLAGFLAWAVEAGYLESAPALARLPKRTTGTRVRPPRELPDVTEEQVRRLVAALPEWSSDAGGWRGPRFPVRARFVVAYETGLRPSTLARLSVPEHWSPGSAELHLWPEGDKARHGRTVPLTPAAVAALSEVAPRRGLIFGAHDYRSQWAVAVAAVGLPTRLTPYDLRHARATHLLDAGASLTGVMYLLGHRHVATTSRYLRTSRRAAEEALRIAGVSPQNRDGVGLAGAAGDAETSGGGTARGKRGA